MIFGSAASLPEDLFSDDLSKTTGLAKHQTISATTGTTGTMKSIMMRISCKMKRSAVMDLMNTR